MQQRRELQIGAAPLGCEWTLAVDDVDGIAQAVEAAGGRILVDKTTIAGVGDLVFFEHTEGNVAGAMRYDPSPGQESGHAAWT